MRILLETISLAAIPFYLISTQLGAAGAFVFTIMSNMTILPWQLKNLDPDWRNLTLPLLNFVARTFYILGAVKGFITGKSRT